MQNVMPHFKNIIVITILIQLIVTPFFVTGQTTGWNNGGGNWQKNGFANVNTPKTDSVLWQISAPGANGNPLFIEGNYLVTMRFFSLTNAPVECYDLNSGSLIWSVDVTNGGGRSLPVGLRNEKVFVVRYTDTFNDTLYALDVSTGLPIWVANVNVGPYITETAVFDSTGNMYIGGNLKTYKINPINGQMIWQTTTVPMASGSGEMVINNTTNTGYTLEQNGGVSYLWAIDLATGTKKYTHVVNELQPGGNVPQSAIMVGNNGIIYVQLTEDNVAALTDNGAQLSVLWQEEIYGNSAFSLMCSGADGSVYAPSNGRIIRFDPLTGDTLNLSQNITQGGFFSPRLSASANGIIYATNGENFVYAFDSTLNLLWSDFVPYNNTSGVIIAPNGLVAVAGQNMIKVYAPAATTSIAETTQEEIKIFPNPSSSFVFINADEQLTNSVYTLIDLYGKKISSGLLAGKSTVIDVSKLPAACYFLRIENSNQTFRLIKN
jgi:outer membrane protein assembly factor BamB